MSNSRVSHKEVERTDGGGDVMYSGAMWPKPASIVGGPEHSPDCVIKTKLWFPMPGERVAYGGQVSQLRLFKQAAKLLHAFRDILLTCCCPGSRTIFSPCPFP